MISLREQIQDLVLHDKGASDFRIEQILQKVEDRITDLDHYSLQEICDTRKIQGELFVRLGDLMKLLEIKTPKDDCEHDYRECLVNQEKHTLCYNCGTEKPI
jgi:hypothetical protein